MEEKGFWTRLRDIVLSILLLAVSIFVLSVFLFGVFQQLQIATTLADHGVHTTATILEYRPTKLPKGGIQDDYQISYDNHLGLIDLKSNNYRINEKIRVVYDKSNPKIVWVGSPSDTAWELFRANDGDSLFGLVLAGVVVILMMLVGYLGFYLLLKSIGIIKK